MTRQEGRSGRDIQRSSIHMLSCVSCPTWGPSWTSLSSHTISCWSSLSLLSWQAFIKPKTNKLHLPVYELKRAFLKKNNNICIFILLPRDQFPPVTEKQKAFRKRRGRITSFSLVSRQTRVSRETCPSRLSRLSAGSLVTWGSGRTGGTGRVAAVSGGNLVEHHFHPGHLT